MTAPSLTSVIIVTHHTGDILEKAVQAVLAQTATIELILVNNGNPPEIEEMLVSRFKDDPMVRLMTGHGNVGLAKGYNLGARVATGERMLLLSPYAVIPNDTVEKLIAAEAHIKRPFAVGVRLVDENGEEYPFSRKAIMTPKLAAVQALRLGSFFPKMPLNLHLRPLPKKIMTVPSISHSFIYMAREDFAFLKGFDETYSHCAEELDFFTRFRRKGGTCYFLGDVEVTIATSTEMPSVETEKARTKGLIRYYNHHFGDETFTPFLWLLDLQLWLAFMVKMMGPLWRERARVRLAQGKARLEALKKR